jgi:hypothetical protein
LLRGCFSGAQDFLGYAAGSYRGLRMFKWAVAGWFLIATSAFGGEIPGDFQIVGLAAGDCFRSSNAAIKPGMQVSLIVADHRQQISALIGPRAADCTDPAASAEAGYRISTPDPFDFAVAVLGDAPASVQAHSCASSQGINLFLTSSQQTKALWHGYYNRGHPIESDCMAEDLMRMQEHAR